MYWPNFNSLSDPVEVPRLVFAFRLADPVNVKICPIFHPNNKPVAIRELAYVEVIPVHALLIAEAGVLQRY